MIAMIVRLCGIEKVACKSGLSREVSKNLRQRYVPPILDRLRCRLLEFGPARVGSPVLP